MEKEQKPKDRHIKGLEEENQLLRRQLKVALEKAYNHLFT
jgi:hypothetical protein